jgi:hypothetical protein
MNNEQNEHYLYGKRDHNGRRIMNEHIRRNNPYESYSREIETGSSHSESSANHQNAGPNFRLDQNAENYSHNSYYTHQYQVS